jgi:hypothetical protein
MGDIVIRDSLNSPNVRSEAWDVMCLACQDLPLLLDLFAEGSVEQDRIERYTGASPIL